MRNARLAAQRPPQAYRGAAADRTARPTADRPAAGGSRLPGLLYPAALALLLVGGLFAAQRRIDFSYDEEGFQWYGVVAALHGEVPLRDFYSYDPGRYYWGAVWGVPLGDGLLALRLSSAVFQAGGLFFGLLAARRALRREWMLIPVGLVLLLWMAPRNKLFEAAIAMAGVYAGVALLERPSRQRHLWAGVVVGLGAFFGKNHGLYLGLGFLLLILYLELRWRLRGGGEAPPPLTRRLLWWALGIGLGASPLLLMLAAVPGFFRAYLDSILFFLAQGRTNFPLPVPWPWSVRFARRDLLAAVQLAAFSACFLLPLLLWPAAALLESARLCAARQRRAPPNPARVIPAAPPAATEAHRVGSGADGPERLLLAAFFVGIFYLHHAFSRADLAHLAPSFHPVLIGLIALPGACGARWRRPAAVLVAVLVAWITVCVALPASPLFQDLTTGRFGPRIVAGDELQLRPHTVQFLDWVEEAVAERVPAGEPIVLLPDLPGIYPILHRMSPVWNDYPIWPSVGRLDQCMLRELMERHVHWAVFSNFGETTGMEGLRRTKFRVDRRGDLRFSATHPLVWAYLTTSFEPVATFDPHHPWRGLLLELKPAAQTPSVAPAFDPR